MRLGFILFCNMFCSISFGQISIVGDTLVSNVYDTTKIEIRSLICFPFCSNTYSLPRDCHGNNPPNCCSYSTSLRNNQKIAEWGYVSCYNGSSFTWHYSTTLENAKSTFEDIPTQIEKQQKKFLKKSVKCLIYNKEAEAYILEQESYQGYKSYTLTTYGSYNGFNFYLEYHSNKEINSTENIQPVFRQILRIQ
jgi:hypothetical protein